MQKRTVYCYNEMTATFGTSLDSSDIIEIKFTKIIIPEEKENPECAYYALKKAGVKTEELENLVNVSEEGIKKTPILYKQTSFMNHKGSNAYIQCPSNILKIGSDESSWLRPGDSYNDFNIISWDTDPESCLPKDFNKPERQVLSFYNGKVGMFTLEEMSQGKYKQ